MATRYIIDINHNDDLMTVIKKCNRNFKVIVGQQSKLDQIEANDASDAVSNIVSGAVGEAVDSLVGQIESEARARRNADEDILNIIENIGPGTNDYTQLINKPQIEDVTLQGNKTFDELNLIDITNSEIETITTL